MKNTLASAFTDIDEPQLTLSNKLLPAPLEASVAVDLYLGWRNILMRFHQWLNIYSGAAKSKNVRV